MERITTALLISDDLDDHQAFTEAFERISPSMIVIAVLSQEKALDLLASRKLVPDYIFLDLTSPNSDVTKFMSGLRTAQDGKKISVTIYGNEEQLTYSGLTGVGQFEKDYEFPDLVQYFRRLINQPGIAKA